MQKNEFSPNKMIEQITGYTPIILFVTMLLLFVIVGIVQNQFYNELFASALPQRAGFIGLTIPLVVQILRLTSGLLSASFFKTKRFFLGTLVFIFSIWLSMFEHNEVKHMAEIWGNVTLLEADNIAVPILERKVELSKEALQSIMQVMIWAALVLEFFLALWLGGSKAPEQKTEQKKEETTNSGLSYPFPFFSPNSTKGNEKVPDVQSM